MTTTTYGSGSMNIDAQESKNLIDSRGFSESISQTDYEDGSSTNDENTYTATTLDNSEYCSTWKEYFSSWRFVELVLCVVPVLVIGICDLLVPERPTMRPIPFQYVMGVSKTEGSISGTSGVHLAEGGTGGHKSYTDTAWNLVNNEIFYGDTVKRKANMIYTGVCPWLLQLFLAWFLVPSNQRNPNGIAKKFYQWDAVHRTTCVYFVGIGLTEAISNRIKYYVGYLRPIFLDRCQPYYDDEHSDFRCLDEENHHTRDARISFPSNHAGWCFCGMMLLSMYLERRFGLSSISSSASDSAIINSPSNTLVTTKKNQELRRRDQQAVYRLLSLVCYSPMLVAVFVAASRVVDNKHFPADVVCGAVLGGSIASLVFGIWFPQ